MKNTSYMQLFVSFFLSVCRSPCYLKLPHTTDEFLINKQDLPCDLQPMWVCVTCGKEVQTHGRITQMSDKSCVLTTHLAVGSLAFISVS